MDEVLIECGIPSDVIPIIMDYAAEEEWEPGEQDEWLAHLMHEEYIWEHLDFDFDSDLESEEESEEDWYSQDGHEESGEESDDESDDE